MLLYVRRQLASTRYLHNTNIMRPFGNQCRHCVPILTIKICNDYAIKIKYHWKTFMVSLRNMLGNHLSVAVKYKVTIRLSLL